MSKFKQRINVAIDGPAGAGKSTVARRLAAKLQYIYVDTGAMYRAVALQCIEQNLRFEEVNQIVQLAEQLNIELVPNEQNQQVLVNGEDVTERIRDHLISQSVSQFAQIENLRKILVKKQQALAEQKGVVMDGRDIGSHVLPNAEVKVYLTASANKRAERRYHEMKEKGTVDITVQQLMVDITKRDEMDQQRKVSPLIIPNDACVIDSSCMTIDNVVEEILKLCMEKIDG